MLVPTKILVPTDFSQYSDRALDQALDIAKQYNAKVFLLHVLHEQVYFASGDFAIPEKVAQQFRIISERVRKRACRDSLKVSRRPKRYMLSPLSEKASLRGDTAGGKGERD